MYVWVQLMFVWVRLPDYFCLGLSEGIDLNPRQRVVWQLYPDEHQLNPDVHQLKISAYNTLR